MNSGACRVGAGGTPLGKAAAAVVVLAVIAFELVEISWLLARV